MKLFINLLVLVLINSSSLFAQIPLTISDPAFLGKHRSSVSCGAAQAALWSAQVVSNGGAAPSAATIAAVSDFWCSMINAGITNKIYSVNCFVPDNLTAAITPLYRTVPTIGVIWTNHNFVSGDLTTNGLKGDGSSKYLDTGIRPSTDIAATNSAGISAYFYVAGNASQVDIGAYNNINQAFILSADNGGDMQFTCWTTTAGQGFVSATASGFQGFLSGNRTANNAVAIYKASSSVSFATAASNTDSITSTRPVELMWIFTLNNGGTPFAYSTNTISYVSFHQGFTSTEAQAEYNAVQTLRTALGGGYR